MRPCGLPWTASVAWCYSARQGTFSERLAFVGGAP